MEASSELDALIAEKVMEWHRSADGMNWIDKDGKNTGWFTTEHGSRECDPFSPSEDIAAAWRVVNKLNKGKFVLELGAGEVLVEFQGYGVFRKAYCNPDTDVPLVICLAALDTV